MTKNNNKLSEPFDHHAYERDSQWLPTAITVAVMISACALVYLGGVILFG